MLEGLYAAASGMNANQAWMDTLSNNIANSSTDGYKQSDVAFADLVYQSPGSSKAAQDTPSIGTGAQVAASNTDLSQGTLSQTNQPLDVAIQGSGYLEVRQSDGSTALTRAGSLALNSKGQITTADGDTVLPGVTIPTGTDPNTVHISPTGAVTAGGHSLGQIGVMTVSVPGQMADIGDNKLVPTAASGPIQRAAAGSFTISQGSLEQSNVDLSQAFGDIVSAERGYQVCSDMVKSEDQMWNTANQLRQQ